MGHDLCQLLRSPGFAALAAGTLALGIAASAGVVEAKFYRPLAPFHRSRGGPTRDMALLMKADGDPLALAAQVQALVRRLDPDVPVSRVRTMTDVVNASVAGPRLARPRPLRGSPTARLALGLSAVALLAGLGPALWATRTDPAAALREG